MSEVTIRDLRNHGGEIVERAARGETLTVTRTGKPVAEVRALPRLPLDSATLLARWQGLPDLDPAALRADLDTVIDSSL